MLAAKDSKPVTSGERETTTTENEKSSATSTPQPSGLGELAAIATAPAGRGQGAVQRVQVGSAPGADMSEVSREGAGRRLSPTLATRPIKYALEIWVELEVSPGVYGAPEDDSYGVDFTAETLNQAYPGCTGLYLDLRPMKLSQPVKDWKGRTGGELVGSFSTGSPPCDWVPHYRQSPNHSSLRQPQVQC